MFIEFFKLKIDCINSKPVDSKVIEPFGFVNVGHINSVYPKSNVVFCGTNYVEIFEDTHSGHPHYIKEEDWLKIKDM